MTGPGSALIGRAAELARLRGRLAEALGGHPRTVICSGEPGIGKTRLLEALSDEAESIGAQVLWSRSPELPDAPPFWLWRQALGAEALDDIDPATERVVLFERLAQRLVGVTADRGAVVVVDDIHRADESSLPLCCTWCDRFAGPSC